MDDSLADRYRKVRQQSLNLCAPFEPEDYQVQPMDDASPPKWHLAHVTWFFETFILKPHLRDYRPCNNVFEALFNSYYNGVGNPYPRPKRGLLSRPTLQEVLAYRAHVDEYMLGLLQGELTSELNFRVELGLHHEQQHQELILTDAKYNLGNNPLKPAYREAPRDECLAPVVNWLEYAGGLVEVGAGGTDSFVFDNETPRHQVYLAPYCLASHPVSNGEFMAFIRDGGYERPELWLSDGWGHLASLGEEHWDAPLYWRKVGDDFVEYGLTGEQPVDPNQPVCHVSGYEADAYARWKGCRLPSEAEWEHVASRMAVTGNFVESERLHPVSQSADDGGIAGLFGDVWEWTASGYSHYPGFKPFEGQLGEYNGKFMANQWVLRGGSCATPLSHIRPSYRNFFYPLDRWQFSGIRLARDAV